MAALHGCKLVGNVVNVFDWVVVAIRNVSNDLGMGQ